MFLHILRSPAHCERPATHGYVASVRIPARGLKVPMRNIHQTVFLSLITLGQGLHEYEKESLNDFCGDALCNASLRFTHNLSKLSIILDSFTWFPWNHTLCATSSDVLSASGKLTYPYGRFQLWDHASLNRDCYHPTRQRLLRFGRI